MAYSIIDTEYDGTSFYSQTTTLDGEDFEFNFFYNARDEHWYLNLRTSEGEEIEGCEGIKLVQGGWPIRRVTDTSRPPGELYVLGPDAEEPGLFDLGQNTSLMYVPEADLP